MEVPAGPSAGTWGGMSSHAGPAETPQQSQSLQPSQACFSDPVLQPLDFLFFFALSHSAAACFHSSAVQTEDCSRWLRLKGNRGPERRVALINWQTNRQVDVC